MTTLDELIKQLTKVNEALWEEFPIEDPDKQVLARMAKLYEESGELANEVLRHLKLQRQEKMNGYHQSDLEKEWVDVLNSLILLGIHLKLDIPAAINIRMQEINQRYQLE